MTDAQPSGPVVEHGRGDLTAEERRQKLSFLREKRDSVDRSSFEARYPVEVPRRLPGRGRHAPGLTLVEMGRLLGLRDGSWYADLERGQVDNAPVDRLFKVAELLDLTPRQYEFLCVYACRPKPGYPAAGLPGGYREVLDLYQGPAYFQDAGWNLLRPKMYNAAAEALFNGIPDDFNFIRWVLLERSVRRPPEGGRRHAWLPDFWQVWAPRALPVVRAAYVARPDNATLARLHADLAADPEIGPIYQGRLPPYPHTDGDLRPFVHGSTGERGMVRINVLTPRGSDDTLMLLNWHPGA
ncbi:MmyB family transcriptional regulator [Streptantibioticus cattleyicolor]|uniref:HTH cro/C1-type domain-containing protein n=2 Tax=Streptantibioticus cattleyicolor TaxID=29303 RepID=F8JNC8_STREN|nr:helix-turn-helix transcriptional regulator [Streptantibioticus cattleyicolor]AEW99111.1 hypothetical protein SCATT_p09180 [Streptantibioticus cattleyicolor NRRL 8057 = DSM 46488]CAD18968.1 hypothetical protein [Streptantibioticus cattleyicolor]CCB71845.1 conserved protein of unknown function [Streptantibioticus cattleyicolor NRRL 8057 = DSM 46488]